MDSTYNALLPNGVPVKYSDYQKNLLMDVKIDAYDTNNNPTQFHKLNNLNSSYIWGYKNSLPVIVGENIDIGTLTSKVITSLPSGFNTLDALLNSISSFPNSNWTTFNHNLRNNLPVNTMITTYTYKPLIGMASQTDPNGIITYYEYDPFGRLKQVKDRDQNVLKKYDYHYKGQQ